MQCDIRYKPAFATIFVTLEPGESITAEAGAMVSMDSMLTMKTEFSGGFLPALGKKLFGGESLFVNVFANKTSRPLQVVLSQSVIGDIAEIELQGRELYFQPGAYIAHTAGVKMTVGWAGFTSWLMGEGLFKLKIGGIGKVFFGAYGGITKKTIAGQFIVDNSHLVAYEPGIKMGIKLSGGLLGSLTSGEGLVNRLSGHGDIYLQSRSFDGLLRFLRPQIGKIANQARGRRKVRGMIQDRVFNTIR
ncbi:TIGR00266 family protein [Xenococcus sp. PCC 7305]|uniref:TIGR00266 family protein n=1 Tax=Xenococcus sp. PCC 7305 TaxID=102125 RepID=UPI0002ACEACF|nr:TIGR00266 family protein [Xenococcus sp. PCC 7305]ELS04862.1 TIGR00266 family protein [Xenococcus sp. PCC 7305]